MKRTTRSARRRRGAIVVLAAILMAMMVALTALAIDIGYLLVAKTELQHTADCAALAAAMDLVPDNSGLTGTPNMTTEISLARTHAVQFAAANYVRNQHPVVDSNPSNNTSGDVVIGYLSDPSNQSQTLDTSQMSKANAAQVTVRRTTAQNGEVALFFARIFGINTSAVQAVATAALRTQGFNGFKTPGDNSNLQILPITLKIDSWNSMLAGTGADNFGWDSSKGVTKKGDGLLEIELYPDSATPGNFGTVDIGSPSNSTADISRQILYGISPSDMAQMPGGQLAFDSNGQLFLNGDTGVSAGIQNELKAIEGQPRAIPLYQSVVNPGGNATYTIIKWVGIRVMDVKLTGALKLKSVTVQAAYVPMKGGIGGGNNTSQYVYSSNVWLVR